MRNVVRRSSFVVRHPLYLLTLAVFFLSAAASYAETKTASISYAEKLFLQGRYDRAVSEFDNLIESRSPRRDEIYYLKGLSELKLNAFASARESFETIISRHPNSHRLFDAYIGIGDSYFLAGDVSLALSRYEEAANRFQNGENISVVYHRLGNCYRKLGEAKKAGYYFDRLKTLAPLSFEAAMPAASSGDLAPPKPAVKERQPSTKGVFKEAGEGYYSVQTGSFRNKKNAEKMAHQLFNRGYDSYMETPAASSGQYKVKVGKYKSKDQAEKTARKLRGEGYTTKICNGDV